MGITYKIAENQGCTAGNIYPACKSMPKNTSMEIHRGFLRSKSADEQPNLQQTINFVSSLTDQV